jgi:hypothetical protein
MENKRIRVCSLALSMAALFFLGGCATQQAHVYDYSAFKEARPRSILVLPPVNDAPDVTASYSFLSVTTAPLAESGYYVFPVTLVDETFKQNGLTSPNDIQEVPITKLRQIFGADAALYIRISNYGTSYKVIASETRVTADAKLIDLRSGATLWNGKATASSAEGDNHNSGGIVGLLVKAVVKQITETLSDHGHTIATLTSNRLLSAGMPNGILVGPRSPAYLKDGAPSH